MMAFISGRIALGYCIHRLEMGKRIIEFYECFLNHDDKGYCVDLGDFDMVGQVYLVHVSVDVLLASNYKEQPISAIYNGVENTSSLFNSKELTALFDKFNIYVKIRFPLYFRESNMYLVNDVKKIFHKIL